MATLNELQTQLDDATAKRDGLDTQLQNALTQTERNRIKKLLDAAQKEVDRIQGLYDTEQKRVRGAAKEAQSAAAIKGSKESVAQGDIAGLEKQVTDLASRFGKDPTNDQLFSEYQLAMKNLFDRYGFYEERGIVFPRIVEQVDGAYRQTTSPAKATPTTNIAPRRATAGMRGEGVGPSGRRLTGPVFADKELGVPVVGEPTPTDNLPGGGGGGGGGTPGAPAAPAAPSAADRKAFVDAELAKRKLADTPENRAMLRKEFNAKSTPTAPAVLTPELEESFKTKYPTYAWMLTDLDRTKYSDVFQLIAEASNPLKEMDPAEFKRRYEGTSFVQELATKKINRELVVSIGSFSWGTGQLARFLNKANQYGYTGESLKQAAYQALFEKDVKTGEYVNPNAINEVKSSTPYLRLKKIGTDYLSPLSDDRIIETLTGGISEDDVLRLTREKAIATHPHLTRQIEAGLTLSDLAYDYQRTAADLLERPASEIDMSKGKFALALKTGETGKERMMSTSEWEQLVKSDVDFGWQYTKQANQQATELALGLSKIFGKNRI